MWVGGIDNEGGANVGRRESYLLSHGCSYISEGDSNVFAV